MRYLPVLLVAALAACEDASGQPCEAGSLGYCCWVDGDGDTICAVESLCDPNAPEFCTDEPGRYTWHMEEDLDGANRHWGGMACYVEDTSLDAECSGGA